jgi:type IV pilus secretin PilQ/predicted competence protein
MALAVGLVGGCALTTSTVSDRGDSARPRPVQPAAAPSDPSSSAAQALPPTAPGTVPILATDQPAPAHSPAGQNARGKLINPLRLPAVTAARSHTAIPAAAGSHGGSPSPGRSFDHRALESVLQAAAQTDLADNASPSQPAQPSAPGATDTQSGSTAVPNQEEDETEQEQEQEPEIKDESDYLNVLEGPTEERPEASDDDGPSDQTTIESGAQPTPTSPARTGLYPRPQPKPSDGRTSLHLNDVDVRKVFEMLSREHAMNILVSPNVKGTVTADLSNLTLEQTLDAILKSCSLAAKSENGVLYIYTPQELELNSPGQDDDPSDIRVFQLNYVRSTDLEKLVKPFLSAEGKITATPASQVGIKSLNQMTSGSSGGGGGGGGGGGSGGGSSKGGSGGQSITGGDALPEQEAIVVQDRRSVLAKIEGVIRELDVQPAQVLIEAVILYVTHEHSCELGVNFGLADSTGEAVGLLGNGALINSAAGFSPLTAVTEGAVKGVLAFPDQGMKFGFTGTNGTAFIKALERIGEVDVLASPRLLVLNKQPAELQLGERLGYSTLSQSIVSTTQQIQFLDVGTLLRVRPFVSKDGMVRLEVHPERSRGAIVDGIPQASTQEVTTNVMVPDGATLVIGGLMDQEVELHQQGFPGLSRLPVVGALFRVRETRCVKKELIVLLTTRIWNPHDPSFESCPSIPSGTRDAILQGHEPVLSSP